MNNLKWASARQNLQKDVRPADTQISLRISMCPLQPAGYPKRDKQEPLPYWVDVKADLSLSWSQRSYQRICRPLAQIFHYENTPIQIYWKFYNQNQENYQIKNSDIFHISAQNIDCGYSLEPPRWGGSNENPQSMFF